MSIPKATPSPTPGISSGRNGAYVCLFAHYEGEKNMINQWDGVLGLIVLDIIGFFLRRVRIWDKR
jgi:hypothetical protein